MIELNYRDARPIYEQIMDGIQKLILTDSLMVDEKLPSVRELASKMAINPNTISRAYKELEADGYIYSVSGKGTFVAEKQGIKKQRTKELLVKFDEVTGELISLSVSAKELRNRITSVENRRKGV